MDNNECERAAIGTRLAQARKDAGLSQGQVARLLDIHRPTISEIEAGRRKVSAEELSRFSEIYDVDLGWLIGKPSEKQLNVSERVELAARELVKLMPADLDTVIELLTTLRNAKQGNK